MLAPFIFKNRKFLCKNWRVSLLVLKRRVCQASLDKEQIAIGNGVSLDILGSGHRNIPPSIILNTPKSSYLFNCGENAARCMQESRHRRYKLRHLFFTSLSWSRVGGLPGQLLNLGGNSKNQAIIHCYGPSKLQRFVDISEVFIVLPKSQVVCHKHTEMPFEDFELKIDPVTFYSSSVNTKQEMSKVNVSLPSNQSWYSDIDNEIFAQMKSLGQQTKNEYIAYICKLDKSPGNVKIDQLEENGYDISAIPRNAFKELGQMKDFILPSGEKLLASELVQASKPAPIFIIMECPNIEIMESVIENPTIKKHQVSTANMKEDIASLVVHMTPPHILNNPKYRKWMKNFGTKTEHVVLNEDSPPHCGHKFLILREKLNLIDDRIFPLLSNDIMKTATTDRTAEEHTVSDDEMRLTYGDFNLKYHLKPNKFMDRSLLIPVDLEEPIAETKTIQDFEKTLDIFHNKIAELPSRTTNGSYPEVVFLGTGSASPNLYRNASSILINISPQKSMLLDCGEGTFYQLYRMYGESVDDILLKIECIYISHGHPDHHLGLVEILNQRQKLSEKLEVHPPELSIICSRKISNWLNEFNYLQDQPFLTNIQILEPSYFRLDGRSPNFRLSQQLIKQLGLQKIETAPTVHYANPYAVAIIHQDGWKIVYSGDTTSPCPNLIKLGKNATLLIHEATLEDTYTAEARKKRHSTTSQAIRAAEDMGAEFVILTHFSQRYSKVTSDISRDEICTHPKLGIAFDNMKVHFKDFPVLNSLLPVLRTLFEEDLLEMTLKSIRKNL